MYVVLQIGSTQYKVSEKDEILVPHLKIEEGKNLKIDKVLLFADGSSGSSGIRIGMPYLDDVKVEARVMNHQKGEKIRVFKMKPKKHYKRTRGHRSLFTLLKILKINVLSGSEKASTKEEAMLSKGAETIVEAPETSVEPRTKKEKKEKAAPKIAKKSVKTKAKTSTPKAPRKKIKKEE